MLLEILLALAILYVVIGAVFAALFLQQMINRVDTSPQDVRDSYNSLTSTFGAKLTKIFMFIAMTFIWPKIFVPHTKS